MSAALVSICSHCQAVMSRAWSACAVCLVPVHLPDAPVANEAMTHAIPCVACGRVDRWNDAGVLRCRHCWPHPLTRTMHELEAPAHGNEQAHTHLTRQELRDAVREAMGKGLKLQKRETRWRVTDARDSLSAEVVRALGARKDTQDLLEACSMLGPILPPCRACGDLRMWFDRETEQWRCWACVPPMLRTSRKESV